MPQRRVIQDGTIAGLIGASAVALWFLALDLVHGRVLFTPAALGSAVFLGARSAADVQITAPVVLGYTALHGTGFLLIGLIVAALIAAAEKEPNVLLGMVLLFVTFEVLFLGLLAILASWLLNSLQWWTILVANVIAAAAMGFYLWRAHPVLRRRVAGQPWENRT